MTTKGDPVAINAASAMVENRSRLICQHHTHREEELLTRYCSQDSVCELTFNQRHILSEPVQNAAEVSCSEERLRRPEVVSMRLTRGIGC